MGVYRAAAVIPTGSVLSRIATSFCWRPFLLIRFASGPVIFCRPKYDRVYADNNTV